ncbi:MAG: DUF4846 domain-containing protein [Bacteroidetes bacterium]|nr:DUF4846 domain-containing protein [Bacteroidota bacterium]
MKKLVFGLLPLFFCLIACRGTGQKNSNLINPSGMKLVDRIQPPSGFERTKDEQVSFATYLRNLKLKPNNSKVLLYNGKEKYNQDAHIAVVDMEIGKADLQQCADAVIRLRSEYLFSIKEYQKIHYNFTSGDRFDLLSWFEGYRQKINGNKVAFIKTANKSSSYDSFRKYLDVIFSYAGTLSLSKELIPVKNLNEMKIGDVFIKGGSPGHAVTIVDIAINPKTNKKVFLLAQSYMPAQDIQILKNPNNSELSPWYSEDFDGSLLTPEWTFEKSDLKRFKD